MKAPIAVGIFLACVCLYMALPGINATIRCNICITPPEQFKNCSDTGNINVTCNGTDTCHVITTLYNPDPNNLFYFERGMTQRSCHAPKSVAAADDWQLFNTLSKGDNNTMVCVLLNGKDVVKGPPGKFLARKCLCAQPFENKNMGCNQKTWDEIMVQPVIIQKDSYSPDDILVAYQLGANASSRINEPLPSGLLPNEPLPVPLATTTAITTTVSVVTETPISAVSGGSNTGLIVGVVVGVVVLLGAVGGGAWYWFKVRKGKPKKPGNRPAAKPQPKQKQ
ncbi:uncharacterized protein LOC129601541 [Paramacrobiotus metropolitanus]|uniref:uncharacterized protein LOC129601541 n=1 Tax=Paramacrobiotus metropolitanus TaxID=2943436 RepID=UPI002445BAC9|nr:uncharacterized protein LOC129601541 [Paramacrobiotus metropolitanus]